MIIFEQKRLGTVVTVALVLLAIVQVMYYSPILPDRIASHYNLMLQPDRWADKNSMLISNIAVVLIMALLFQSLSWLVYKLPPSTINLPHKTYWLAAERKKQTLDSIASFLIWLSNVTLLLITVVFNLIYQANISSGKFTHNFWFAIAIYFLTVTYMIYHLFKRFQKVPPGFSNTNRS
ncbi:MAG: DUF1648 domain-containing protein [candidate division KSB1 bacterium]|nr:DUF1648 domain-containing protein [candidate division KSB1 bacterium]